jgi:hypothetical protein
MRPEDENALLKVENAALREQVTVLAARVQELEARLAKDSYNSNKPPSSDGLARKTKSLRRRSGNKPGGQIGHPGQTLRLVATPDAVVEHRPALCSDCQRPLPHEALVEWVQQAATALEPVEASIKAALSQAPVLHSDETGVRQAGRLAWIHVASTKQLTHYAVHPKRGAAATQDIGILPSFGGVSIHDGWKPYRSHTECQHALCTIHHLRELTFLEEQYQQTWAKNLKELLREMKAAIEQARSVGAARLSQAERGRFVARYEQLLATGLAANPPPERTPHHRGRQKQSPARNLLERLWLDQGVVLAFLDDLTIPFDNNQAERDLRMRESPAENLRLFPLRPRGNCLQPYQRLFVEPH